MDKIRTRTRHYRGRYGVYSIGCAVVWAIVIGVLAATETSHRMGYVYAVFGGWVIGWLSATAARYVYPPPAKWLPRDEANSEPTT